MEEPVLCIIATWVYYFLTVAVVEILHLQNDKNDNNNNNNKISMLGSSFQETGCALTLPLVCVFCLFKIGKGYNYQYF